MYMQNICKDTKYNLNLTQLFCHLHDLHKCIQFEVIFLISILPVMMAFDELKAANILRGWVISVFILLTLGTFATVAFCGVPLQHAFPEPPAALLQSDIQTDGERWDPAEQFGLRRGSLCYTAANATCQKIFMNTKSGYHVGYWRPVQMSFWKKETVPV